MDDSGLGHAWNKGDGRLKLRAGCDKSQDETRKGRRHDSFVVGVSRCAVNEMLKRDTVEIGEINNIFVRVVPDSIRVKERWLDLFGFSSE